jgi:predicted Zn-dependent peptidase
MGDLRVTRLDSGLTVAVECVPETRSVAAGVWVAVGSRDEPAERAGVSHFLEHLLFKGTATRTGRQISRSVDRMGGDFNAFTTREYTAYYCRLSARHMTSAVELLGDVLTAPALRADDVDSERQVILEELSMDDDMPDDVAHREFAWRVFDGHPLGRNPAGSRQTVKAITTEDIRSFFDGHYRAEQMVVSIASPVGHAEVLAAVELAFGDVRRGAAPISRTAPVSMGPSVSIDDDSEQLHIVVGGHGLPRTDPDAEVLDVVNHVLGGGLSSRLFDVIREQRGLAYSVFSGVSPFSDSGSYELYAGTSPEHGDEVIALMLGELHRLRREGVDDEELAVAVGYLTGAFELGLEDNGARMARTASQLVTVGDVRPIHEQLALWEGVDHTAIRRVIDRVLTVEPLVVTVGPR